MHPLQNGSQVTERPAKKPTSGLAGYFTESGDNNVPSYPGQDWFNDNIDEFINALAIAGIAFEPGKTDHLARLFSFVSNKGNSRVINVKQPPYNFSEAITADNTQAMRRLIDDLQNGDVVDFQGLDYRVYANVQGLLASAANPTSDNAIPFEECLIVEGKNVTFQNGGLYAANQNVSAEKKYFPSTISFINCDFVNLIDTNFEAKGESWGAADLSISETKERRLEFLATNGGHAAYFGRCKAVVATRPSFRLSGSTSPCYFSSCESFFMESPFSNSASLGYAAFTSDAWVGSLDETGFNRFYGVIIDPKSFSESLYQRESGGSVGSDIYAGKGGIVTEDEGVIVISFGGYLADMYANGADKVLGYAFGAGSGSTNINHGCVIRNCQEVVYANAPFSDKSTCRAFNVDAIVGLTGAMFGVGSVGDCELRLTGNIRVNNSRVWSGETGSLSQTSLVASLKPTSIALAYIDCNAGPDLSPPVGSVGGIYSLVSNTKEATYGGVIIEGGEYYTKGFLMTSQGWGGSSLDTHLGLVAKSKARVIDNSALSSPFIQYKNRSDLSDTSTYIYHDLENLDIFVDSLRSIDGGYSITGSGLLEKLTFSRKLNGNIYSIGAYRPRETIEARFKSVIGLSGSNSLMEFTLIDGRPPRASSYVVSNSDYIRILSAGVPTVSDGNPVVALTIEGDVRTDFTVGEKYTFCAA